MAKDTKESRMKKEDQSIKRAKALDKVADKILQSVDSSYNDHRILDRQDAQYQKVIDRQLDLVKGVAGTQVIDFIASIRDQQNRKNNPQDHSNKPSVDATDLFTENVGDIFGYFQDVYKNRYLEVSDLKFISKFIPSIGEAVRIYLDGIVSSDDVSQTITRNLAIKGVSDESSLKTVMDKIEKMETDLKILQKMRVAYKKAIVSGTFYVYHIAYRDLFETYSTGLATGKIKNETAAMSGAQAFQGNQHGTPPGIAQSTPASPKTRNILGVATEAVVSDIATPVYDSKLFPGLESFGEEATYLARDGLVFKCDLESALESTFSSIENNMRDSKVTPMTDEPPIRLKNNGITDRLINSIKEDLPNIYFVNSEIPFDVLNETSGMAEEGYTAFFDKTSSEDINLANTELLNGVDGTHDTKATSGQSFNGVNGTYLKWIDYKYMIPIEILGKKIGYYNISTTSKKSKSGKGNKGQMDGVLSDKSMSLFSSMDVSERRKEEAIQGIVDSISSAIMDQFSVKFVKKNGAFRDLIAECIIANGLVDNDYMIQFIPANNIIEFKCNEDETGKGESILADAMFPAHLLLSIVICKMLNYINKGGNKTIAHISSGKVNKSTTNQVNRVIRDLQSANVTFTDLLSSSMVFSKVTRDSNIAMPKDQAGNRLVEFEVQEGQEINLNTDYETMLDRWCMIALGMPPTMMDYQSNVDVAKKVISDNITVAAHVASLQADLEVPSTELYRVLIEDSDMDEGLKSQVTNSLQFKLPRPRILVNQNNTEALGTASQNAELIADKMLGQNSTDESVQLVRDKLIYRIVKDTCPFIDWSHYEELKDQAEIDVQEDKVKQLYNKATGGESSQNDTGGMPDDGMGAEDNAMMNESPDTNGEQEFNQAEASTGNPNEMLDDIPKL